MMFKFSDPNAHGFIAINKPKDVSSRYCLNRLKKYYPFKIGHTGTLDPFATGMLVVALGEATKFSSHQLHADKQYFSTLKLGEATDTDDLTGTVIEKKAIPVDLDLSMIQTALKTLTGTVWQTAPTYSALKYNGKAHYRYARKGIEVPKKIRKVNIDRYQNIKYQKENQNIEFLVDCKTGTYIRSIGRDLAELLNTKGHLIALNRTYIKPWQNIEMIDIFSQDFNKEKLYQHMKPTDFVLPNITHRLTLSDEQISKLKNGMTITNTNITDDSIHEAHIKVYDQKQQFHGLCKKKDFNTLKTVKMLQFSQNK